MGKYYLEMGKIMEIQTPIIFDTDCLSSFLWIKRFDILNTLFPNQLIIPQIVYDELSKMRKFTRYSFVINDLDIEVSKNIIQIEDIPISSPAATEYINLINPNQIKQIGKGEAAAIVLAKLHNGTLASNNLRDILPHITSGYPPYISTDAILYLYYKQGNMSVLEGCQIWDDMKSKKRALPAYDFSEVIRRFDNK